MRTFRPIGKQRARFLRKRGEHVWWSKRQGSYFWEMKIKYMHRFPGDITVIQIDNRGSGYEKFQSQLVGEWLSIH